MSGKISSPHMSVSDIVLRTATPERNAHVRYSSIAKEYAQKMRNGLQYMLKARPSLGVSAVTSSNLDYEIGKNQPDEFRFLKVYFKHPVLITPKDRNEGYSPE
jgi:hypothetical protein